MAPYESKKLKTELQLAVNRLKLQQSKKANNAKIKQREIAELLERRKDESARIRVEAVIRDDFLVEAYEILELFCELINARLLLMDSQRTCPPDCEEACQTLVYAAMRVGSDIPELPLIAKQLEYKYGREFIDMAVNNRKDMVNGRVIHKLGVVVPDKMLVYKYLDTIAQAKKIEWSSTEVFGPLVGASLAPGDVPVLPTPPGGAGGAAGAAPIIDTGAPRIVDARCKGCGQWHKVAVRGEPPVSVDPSIAVKYEYGQFEMNCCPGGGGVHAPAPPAGLPDLVLPAVPQQPAQFPRPDGPVPGAPSFPMPPTDLPPPGPPQQPIWPPAPGAGGAPGGADAGAGAPPSLDDIEARFNALRNGH